MNTQNKKQNEKKGGSGVLGLIILVGLLISSNADLGDFPAAFILFIVVIVGFVIVSAAKKSKKDGAKERTPGQRSAPARRSALGSEHAEQAVHCHHSTGKQKYLEQLDSFLANGIIDRAEYRLLKERYSKLNIEDDYH